MVVKACAFPLYCNNNRGANTIQKPTILSFIRLILTIVKKIFLKLQLFPISRLQKAYGILPLSRFNKMAKLEYNDTLKRLHNNYRLSVMNDDTFEEVVTVKLSRLSVYIGLSTGLVLLVGLTIALIAFSPIKYYIPGYGTRESRTALQLLKIRTDSLEQSIKYKDQYLESIKKVLNGTTPIQRDTIILQAPKTAISNE